MFIVPVHGYSNEEVALHVGGYLKHGLVCIRVDCCEGLDEMLYIFAMFRIPIFGYCQKSPESELSSGYGPEFWDP